MRHRIYETLEKKQKTRVPFSHSEDFKYFILNREKLGKFKGFDTLYDSEENDFDILRANILLKGLENKKIFEEEILNIKAHGMVEHGAFVNTLKERTIDQPYFENDNAKIYMPFFSIALNHIYTDEPEKLLELPYNNLLTTYEEAMIDPFDTYGAELFNSYFSSLIKVSGDKHVSAFFNYDMSTIYFINDQGRLDAKLVLFDKYMKRPVYTHMLERITPVCEAYFNNDREAMVEALYYNNLISQTMHKILTEDE